MEEKGLSSVTFLIVGEDFDPDQISTLIGLMPSNSWKKGDKHIFKSGRIHIYDYAGWKLRQEEAVDKCSLEDQIKHWLKLFSSRHVQIKQLKDLGYSIGIICFIVDDDYISFSLNPEIVKGLGELGMELTVECCLHSKNDE